MPHESACQPDALRPYGIFPASRWVERWQGTGTVKGTHDRHEVAARYQRRHIHMPAHGAVYAVPLVTVSHLSSESPHARVPMYAALRCTCTMADQGLQCRPRVKWVHLA